MAQSSIQATCSQAPTCTAAPTEGETTFKVSVRVHAASVPALAEPGRMLKMKMRLGASLGGVDKETEDADFAGPESKSAWFTRRDEAATPSHAGESRQSTERSYSSKFGAAASRGSDAEWAAWRFGDTLTFAARASDLLDSGMRLRLHVQSDVCLGPVQVQMPHSTQDLGEAVVDLRHRVFPAAVASWSPPPFLNGIDCEFEAETSWETPALVFPLASINDSPMSGVEVSVPANVALSFSVNVDPEVLMREVDEASRPLPYKVARDLVSCLTPLTLCSAGGQAGDTMSWATEAAAWGCSDSAVTPRPRERRFPQSLPVLPKAKTDSLAALRKV